MYLCRKLYKALHSVALFLFSYFYVMNIFKFFSKNQTESKQEVMKKFLIVGLGNIGDTYVNTRHNIGFQVLDALAKDQEVSFETEKLGDITRFRHKGKLFILLKPSTYMNLSGKSVKYWMNQEKISLENLCIVTDFYEKGDCFALVNQINNTLASNNDYINERFINIYPNPSSSEIKIEFVNSLKFPINIEIYNSLGKNVESFYNINNKRLMIFNYLKSDFYTIIVTDKNKMRFSNKFIVQ